MMTATLNSNSGSHSIVLSTTGVGATHARAMYDVSLRLTGETYADDHSHALALSVDGVVLDINEVHRLIDDVTAWLELPLETMAGTALVGDYHIGLETVQDFELALGGREDIITGTNHAVSVRLATGRLHAGYSFVTDQSCLRVFVQ